MARHLVPSRSVVAAREPLETLTRAEREVVALVAEGKTTKDIAEDLGISPKTVENHRSHICQKLGLTGTKLGCDRAECGACTVLIDDVPRYSCSVLTHTVRSGRVQTIEGLASADGTLHPVQRAVVDEQGFQCAFCMSGFIMSAVGFLKRRPDPTRAELARGLSGNLCRCCDYNKILNSMMRAAEYTRNGSHV